MADSEPLFEAKTMTMTLSGEYLNHPSVSTEESIANSFSYSLCEALL